MTGLARDSQMPVIVEGKPGTQGDAQLPVQAIRNASRNKAMTRCQRDSAECWSPANLPDAGAAPAVAGVAADVPAVPAAVLAAGASAVIPTFAANSLLSS